MVISGVFNIYFIKMPLALSSKIEEATHL